MIVAVLGASGRSGQAIVREALARGHTVRALVRKADALAPQPGLSVVVGTPTSEADVKAVARGADVVISGLGPQRGSPPDLVSRAARHVIAASADGGPKRYLSVSGAGTTLPGDNKDWKNTVISTLMQTFGGFIVRDKRAEHEALSASDLDFTLARPPMLVEGQKKGVVREGQRGPLDNRLDRADLAAFLLDVAEDTTGAQRRRAPFVSW